MVGHCVLFYRMVKVLLKTVACLNIIFCFVKCLHNKDTLFVCVTLIITVLHNSNFSLYGNSEIKIIIN
jgi:hypothetical protein